LKIWLNAKDAVDNGGKISISCTLEEIEIAQKKLPQGTYAKISVCDNGHGISDEVKDFVFEPFYTTKAASRGMGMGLSLVRSFIAEAKGDVKIDTVKGSGTAVSIFIPVTKQKETLRNIRQQADFEPPNGENFKVLVVEDNQEVLNTISATLSGAGFEVMEANDGTHALSLLENNEDSLDLLCIDGIIPGATSSTVIAKMQSDHPDSRIVVCSGYVEEELVLRGIEKGEFAFIRKPFQKSDLLGCIRQELGLEQYS